MLKIDLLVHAKWVLPMNKVAACLPNHSVAVSRGKIIDILPTQVANKQYSANTYVSKPEHVLMPGFINCHTHTPMTLLRGLADDLPLMEWLEKNIWPTEQAWLGPEFAYDGARLAIAEMIKRGTTCFQEMYFFPEKIAQAICSTGIRARNSMHIMDIKNAWGNNGIENIEKSLALYKANQHNPLMRFSLTPHSVYTVNDNTLKATRDVADEYNLPIQIHCQESQAEISTSLAKHGARPLAHLQQLNFLSSNVMLVHMTQVNNDDIAILKETGAHVIHCPESNMKLASGYCPITRLQSAGINVALGTDSACSNNNLNMMSEIRSAALLAKLMASDAEALPAYQALELATTHAAKAMQWDDEIGQLDIGFSADMITIDMSSLATQPIYHPVSQLVYAASREQVRDVWVAGKRLLDNGKLMTIDEQALKDTTTAWQKKISA